MCYGTRCTGWTCKAASLSRHESERKPDAETTRVVVIILNKNHYTYSNITSAATRLHLQSPSLTVAITSTLKTTSTNLHFKDSCITSTILTVLAITFRATFYYWY